MVVLPDKMRRPIVVPDVEELVCGFKAGDADGDVGDEMDSERRDCSGQSGEATQVAVEVGWLSELAIHLRSKWALISVGVAKVERHPIAVLLRHSN